MTEVDGPVDINECIWVNVTPLKIVDNVSKLNLLMKVHHQCLQSLQTGQFYLRGICLASNDRGATSETFVLDVIDLLQVRNMYVLP